MSDTATDDEIAADLLDFERDQAKGGKLGDIIKENRRIVVLTRELKDTSARLKTASAALVASNENLLERTGELKSTEGALVASDKNLLEANEQLVRLVEELAHTNEKLLKANEQLSNSEKMQKEFINIAAHELRTPIQPILGVLDFYEVNPLAVKAEDEGKIIMEKGHLRLLGRSAARLARLSSDILDATRIECNNLRLKIERNVDLLELVSYATEDAKGKVANGNVEFLTNFPEEGMKVDVDSYRILQVLTNLLDNAIKFTPKGIISTTVKIANNNDQFEVTISDSGKGIDSEVLPRLFQKFASKTDTGSGTGLGLYISKSIIEAHGGKIWAESNKVGGGTTFAFTLPMSSR